MTKENCYGDYRIEPITPWYEAMTKVNCHRDENGNRIEMSPSGITIRSTSNIKIEAFQEIKTSANQSNNI
ncbi:MAG: hypothetical protein IPP71_13590 [Bacteroidetes bacterium]|nr:hypothetical protein [Bacteroidota bacterium]